MSTTTTAPNATSTAVDPSATDRIERSVLIQAPRSRVWRALSNAEEFGDWFGAQLRGQRFEPGQPVRGPLSACGHDDVMFDAVVDRVEPETLLSFHWHPYAIDATHDYSGEERTLVTFTLESRGEATLVRVVESGFDKVPPQRRLEAFRMNDRGWEAQMQRVKSHIESR